MTGLLVMATAPLAAALVKGMAWVMAMAAVVSAVMARVARTAWAEWAVWAEYQAQGAWMVRVVVRRRTQGTHCILSTCTSCPTLGQGPYTTCCIDNQE